MAFKFNPFTGQLDTVPGKSEYSKKIPTRTKGDLFVEEDTQTLFTKRIVLKEGSRIILEGILVEVK
jgi:hypothetical protein